MPSLTVAVLAGASPFLFSAAGSPVVVLTAAERREVATVSREVEQRLAHLGAAGVVQADEEDASHAGGA